MTGENMNRAGLRALAKVHRLCLPNSPCAQDDCKKCRKNAELAWNNALEQADIDENAIWGFEA